MAKDNSVASFVSSSDWFSFFNMAPNGMDLAQRLRYEMDCYSQLASSVCSAFWDGAPNKALQWRNNTLSYLPQVTTLIEGAQRGEQDGIITKLGANMSVIKLPLHRRTPATIMSEMALPASMAPKPNWPLPIRLLGWAALPVLTISCLWGIATS